MNSFGKNTTIYIAEEPFSKFSRMYFCCSVKLLKYSHQELKKVILAKAALRTNYAETRVLDAHAPEDKPAGSANQHTFVY